MIGLKQVIEAYKARGFQIHHILVDGHANTPENI